jgi:ABC-type phosphate transport system substrate-binding protein
LNFPLLESTRYFPFVARFITLAIFLFTSKTAASQAVVVHPNAPVSEISQQEARALFTMSQRSWRDGTPVVVFVLPDSSPIHKEFCKKHLGMFAHQLRQTWDRKVFSGTGQAPETVSTVEEMRTLISKTPGAIGYLPDAEIDRSVRSITIREGTQ